MHLPGKKLWVMDYSQHSRKGALPWEWPSEIKKKFTKAKGEKPIFMGKKRALKKLCIKSMQ